MYKVQSRKRIISVIVTAALLVSLFVIPTGTAEAANYNYGEALQKAIMFYEFQRSGKIPEDSRNNWRGDSGMNDGADNNIDLTGGWYDAGDNVKFNLPMAHSVSMLAWSVYESRDAYVKSGQLSYILDNIKWAADYLIKCHPSPNVYYYQVGDSSLDHSWWGPAEVMQMARPSYRLDTSNPGSAAVGEAAAALAATSVIFKDTNPSYSATCLKHAKELLAFADSTKSDAGYKAAAGCYESHNGFYDELTWASVWVYIASNDSAYLTQAESYQPKWETELGTTTIKYKWVQCWDNKLFGALLLLAKITGKPLYKECIERNLDWWTVGVNGEKVAYTPKGLAWLDMWGSLRYATTQAFIASVYADWSGCDPAKAEIYRDFAKSQVDYALGSTGRSFEVGFGTNPPKRPHHRTAHGSWMGYLDCDIPNYHRHVLYGALVGGPGSNDSYTDDVKNYTNNEVACDYNAGFVGVLAKMYDQFGGAPIAGFNAIEKPIDDEYTVNAAASSYDPSSIQLRITLGNQTAWPARASSKLSCRYFVDISEAVKAGLKSDDITVSTSSSSPAKVSPLIPWDASKNIYYVNVDFSGNLMYPGGINEYKKELYLTIKVPYGSNGWDNTNDFSYNGLAAAGSSGVYTKNIPVYDDGVRVSGEEPSGGSTSPTPPTSSPTSPNPTPTSGGYRLTGYVKPGFNYSGDAAPTLNSGFKVEIEGSGISALTDANGYFKLDNVPGSTGGYTLKISKTGYLTRKITNVIVTKDTSISAQADPVEIWAGDVPGDSAQDNAINLEDIMEFARLFNTVSGDGKYYSSADINADNAINVSDIMIVANHFNKTMTDYPVFTVS